jgi:hypothetical protein
MQASLYKKTFLTLGLAYIMQVHIPCAFLAHTHRAHPMADFARYESEEGNRPGKSLTLPAWTLTTSTEHTRVYEC